MYSTFNEGKSVVAERFIRTLKNKIFKHMTAISKNVCFDVLDDIVNKYNNTIYRTIKMKPIDITDDFLLHTMKNQTKEILNLQFVIVLEFLSTKIFLLKDMFLISQKKLL